MQKEILKYFFLHFDIFHSNFNMGGLVCLTLSAFACCLLPIMSIYSLTYHTYHCIGQTCRGFIKEVYLFARK